MDDRKITVAVCGDSFCAASIDDLQVTKTGRRAHFSQMLEDIYGYRVLHFAHGGFSNAAIFFQIKEAINCHADVVVYNKTWSNRVELSFDNKFNISNGLKNFYYYDPHYESTNRPWSGKQYAPIISTSGHGIKNNPLFTVPDECIKAIELYWKYLYNDGLHTTIDSWVFEYWHDKIVKSGALPIEFARESIGKIAYDFSQANPTFDTPFHTDRATQEQIASNVHNYIQSNLSK